MGQVNLKITAEDRATAVLEKMYASGKNASDRLQTAFDQLGVKTTAAFDKQRQAAQGAYDRIKASGVATADELARAERALGAKLVQIDEEQYGKRTSLMQKFKANWLAVTAAMGAAWFAVLKGFDLAEEAAMGLQKRQAFASLAASHGAAADKILADLKRVSAGTIATQKLIEKAGTSMLLGIEAEYLPKLMEIARASSRITGDTITKSFEDISLAVGRQSRMILDNLGIIVSVEKANAAYAASLGKTAGELTDAERKMAFMKATMEAGQEIIDRVGISADTAAERLQRLIASMKNLRETVGVGVLGVMNVLMGVFQGAAGMALRLSGAIFNIISSVAALVRAKSVAEEYRISAEAALAAGADLYNQAQDSISTGFDLLSGKIDAATAMTAAFGDTQKTAAEEAAKAAEVQAKAVETATSALDRYSRSVNELGREQLKMAESGFSRDLERQEEFFRKSGAAAANLSAPIRSYLSVLDHVYGAQLRAQQGIAATLEDIGADQAARLQQEINIAGTERALAEGRLKGWSSYYDKLKGMHTSAMDAMAKAQEEMLAVKQFGSDLGKALDEKFNAAAALTPYEQFFRDLEGIDADAARAMELSGQKKVEALQEVMSRLKSLPQEVREGDQVVISSLDIYEKASERFRQMQTAAEAAKQAEIAAAGSAAATLAAEMATAQTAMADLQDQILDIDARIAALSKTVIISAADQASDKIAEIQSAMDRLQDKEITITANYVSNIARSATAAASGGSASGESSEPGDAAFKPVGLTSAFMGGLDGRASGGPVYPNRTYLVGERGPELLRMGSQSGTVIPNDKLGGDTNVTIAPRISITMQGGGNASPEQTARELARQLEPELRKLAGRYR